MLTALPRFALVWESELLTSLGGALLRMVRNRLLQESGTQVRLSLPWV